MSNFQAPLVKLTIKKHPSADRLEIAEVGGYQCIVMKGEYKTGDLAVYIPEGAIVPAELIEKMGLTGRLAGPGKNRVKAIKLRKVLSQGLVCPLAFLPEERGMTKLGDDCSALLGLTKHEPVIPASMAGNVWKAGEERTIRYDIENIKKYNRVLEDGEDVVFTEKLHGTWCMMASMPYDLVDPDQGPIVVSSKGQAAKGLALKRPEPAQPQDRKQKIAEQLLKIRRNFGLWFHKYLSKEDLEKKHAFYARKIRQCHNKGVNENNIYWRAAKEQKVFDNLGYLNQVDGFFWVSMPIFVLGEVFGAGVQDLDYGSTSTTPGFRVFDIYIGKPGEGRYLNDEELDAACFRLRLQRVPVLYRGPFSQEKVAEYTSGKESVTGDSKHIREGIVIRPTKERRDSKLGRVQLKSVSEKYLLRKNGTEFN